ncbi:MAG: TonB-dependent receptor [Acidobacteria bacterium]|nr:TonB-dependent receptor [Acidobacteriota bacterium]
MDRCVPFDRRGYRLLSSLGALLLLSFVSAVPAFTQTGQITGQVTDQAGAIVPDAKITLTQTATGFKRELTTNGDGYYTAPALSPGTYSLSVNQTGFGTVTRNAIQLQVGQDLRLDIQLQVGTMNQTMQVQAEAALLDTETHSVGGVVQGRQVVELPLLGRNPYALGELVPGVRIARGMSDLPVDQISTSSVSINGSPGNANEFLLDGAPNTAAAQNQPIIYANADSVQEFKVETNNFSAEYGRAAGGVFNVVTKSGTNNLHGDLYEFLRNDKLNSNDFFANQAGRTPPPFKFNQFGGTLGGPVVLPHLYDGHNRTFFFVSAELVRFVQGVTYTATVPDPISLTGDFSQLRNGAGNSVVIYDPSTTRVNPSGGSYVRSPFPGNIIPSTRIDPVAARILKYWPAPNAAGNPITGANNYVRTDGNQIQKNTFSTRLDHNFTDNTRFFLRYSYDDTPWTRASPYGPQNMGSPAFGPQDFTRYNAVSQVDRIFSPSLLGTLRASFSRLSNFRNPLSLGFDISTLGFPAGLAAQVGFPPSFPAIDITGYNVSSSIANSSRGGTLGETGAIAFGMNNYALQGSITKNAGAHSIKMGGEFRVVQFNTLQPGDASNDFSFGPGFTQGPNPTQSSVTAGNALATFLLGIPGGSVTPVPALALQSKYYAGFVQDEWKIARNFTLNLGLRYELETPRTDRFNQLTNFAYGATPPLNAPGLNLKGALSFVGVNGASRYDSQVDANNFAPRVGFAWHLMPKTVIRAGAGVFYGTNWGIGGAPDGFGISGFSAATGIVTSLDGVNPVVSFSNPYPNGLNAATGSSLGAATLLGQGITFYDRGNVTPFTYQWNFDIQRELPRSVLLDVAYVGTHAVKFPLNLQLDQLPDSALALGDGLRTLVANPFYGQISVGSLAAAKVAQAQLLRPYPQFTGVTSTQASWGNSSYNALQVRVSKRYARGLTLEAAYTYSKMLDYGTGTFGGETLSNGGIQDFNNLRAERSPSALDQTHRLILNGVYALPFHRDQRGPAGHLLGGWQIGVIASLYSGSPLGITSAVNGTYSQGGGQRPNWNGVNPGISNPTPAHWFDTSVFSNPPAYQFGNTPRTFNGARSDVTHNFDLSLIKDTRLVEKLTLQFRAEAFNLTNTPIFAPPNTTFGSPAFGVVSSQANQPRVLQFALKLLF